MARTGQITLEQGIGKNSGKPFTALKLKAGKWSTLHFPTQFEKEYLVEYLKDNQGSFTLDENTEKLVLQAGDYVHNYDVESKFEWNYLVKYFRDDAPTPTTDSKDDATIDLSKEDELSENPFGN